MKEKLFVPPPAQVIKLLENEPQAFKRILIIEDNPENIARMKTSLECRHFDISFAKTAVSGLREIMESDFEFHVVICDVTKPNFSASMFHVAVTRVKPHLVNRFIFITGPSTPTAISDFIKQVSGVILWKPFDTHVLLETISLVLQKQAQRPRVTAASAKVVPTMETVTRERPVRNTNGENLRLIHLSLSAAKKSIRIVSSYFLSDQATVEYLIGACRRGVRVEIYVPTKKNDQGPDEKVHDAWGRLAEAGVKIFSMKTTPDVGRVIICDDSWVCFTHSNFHAPNLNIYHEEFTARYLKRLESGKHELSPVMVPKSATTKPAPYFVESPRPASDFFWRIRSMFASVTAWM